MHPPLEVFIELETKLAAILNRRWALAVREAWPAIEACWEHGNHETAVALVGGIQMAPLRKNEERRIRALCTAMLAYGAQHVSSKAARKQFTNTEPVDLMLAQLRTLTDRDTAAFAVRMLQVESKRQTGVSLTGEDKAIATEEERYASFLQAIMKDSADLGPSSYRARNVILSGGRWSSDLTANLTTSRLVNFGSLDAMRDARIQRYRLKVTLDQRTSQICRGMRNKVFDVAEGFSMLRTALLAQDGEALRSAHPWIPHKHAASIEAMDEPTLMARRWFVPPFHARCRTIIVPAGIVQRRLPRHQPVVEHPNMGATDALEDATSLPIADLVDGGGIMRALRGVGHQTPLHPWEIDALGDLIGSTMALRTVAGRLSVAEAEEIVRQLVLTAVPAGPAHTAVLDVLLAEVRALVGNEAGLFG